MNHVEERIQRELSYLDLNLFLDFDRHPVYGFLYYSVKVQNQDMNLAPLTVVDWCVGSTPLPLSMDIISQVRSQEGDIRDSIAQATAHNAALKELRKQEQIQLFEDIAEEWQKSGRSTGIPAVSSIVVSKDLPVESKNE